MFNPLKWLGVPEFALSRVSSGLTVFVCAGVLIHAIMSDNGGAPDAQDKWQEAKEKAYSIVHRLGPETARQWKERILHVDQSTTASIEPAAETASKPARSSEPSVLSLIRENADVAPGVSTGTGRVSVTVKPGDTLFAIARRHGLRMIDLARLNGLEEPYVIQVGQTLYVAR